MGALYWLIEDSDTSADALAHLASHPLFVELVGVVVGALVTVGAIWWVEKRLLLKQDQLDSAREKHLMGRQDELDTQRETRLETLRRETDARAAVGPLLRQALIDPDRRNYEKLAKRIEEIRNTGDWAFVPDAVRDRGEKLIRDYYLLDDALDAFVMESERVSSQGFAAPLLRLLVYFGRSDRQAPITLDEARADLEGVGGDGYYRMDRVDAWGHEETLEAALGQLDQRALDNLRTLKGKLWDAEVSLKEDRIQLLEVVDGMLSKRPELLK